MSAPTMAERGRLGALTNMRRAALKRQLTAGEVHLQELLADPPEWALKMSLEQVLNALPLIRRKRTARALRVIQGSVWTTLGGMTARQSDLLLDHFREEYPDVWNLWDVMVNGPHEDSGGSEAA